MPCIETDLRTAEDKLSGYSGTVVAQGKDGSASLASGNRWGFTDRRYVIIHWDAYDWTLILYRHVFEGLSQKDPFEAWLDRALQVAIPALDPAALVRILENVRARGHEEGVDELRTSLRNLLDI